MKDDTLLAKWLAGEMNQAELEAFENSSEYPAFVRIKSQFERLQKPQFDQEAILQRVLEHEKNQVKVIPLYGRTWFRIAAVAVLLLGLAITFTMPRNEFAPNGKTIAFLLPDQSEVILNSGSEASFRKWNWENNREVSLSGEAYFKVAKGKKFTVQTDLGTVTVVGTQFNVKAREGRFDVVCYEGKVGVQFGSEQTYLTPGQRISFAEGSYSGILPVKVHEPEWLNREMAFSQENLSRVIAEIERQYDVEINTTVQSNQLFSGVLPADNLDAALKILSVTYHLKIAKTGGIITLTPINAGS